MTARKHPIDIKGIYYGEQASFTDTTVGGGYTAIRARNIKFEPMQESLPSEYQKWEHSRGPDANIPGGYGGTLTFEILLRGGATNESEFMILAKNCGCNVTSRAGTSGGKIASGTANTVVGLTADIGTYVVGDAIMVTSGGSNDTQIRFVSRVQDATPTAPDTTLTVEPDFADNPASGDDLAAIDTYTNSVGEPAAYARILAYEASDTPGVKWDLTGCAGTWKLTTTGANALPAVEFTYQIDSWALTESDAEQQADTFNAAHPLLGDIFYVDSTATAISSIAFDPGIKMSPYTSTSGTNGRVGWLYHGAEPKLEIVPYFDTAWYTKWTGATTFQATFESIKDDDEAWAIHIPAAQVTKVSTDDIGNSHIASSPELISTDPGMNADSVDIPWFAIAVTGGA
jgi:hypothetical protein